MAARIRLSPIARITLGLVSLTAFLLLAVDLLFAVFPDHVDIARQERQKVSENLAVQLTALIQADDVKILRQTLQAVMGRDGDILSLAIRRFDGAIIAQAGDHLQHWIAPMDGRSTLTHVLVPVHTGRQLWGNVEISFRPVAPQSALEWLHLPSVSLILAMGIGGSVIYYLYMRRVLQHLDPSSAIPERVRIAFDTLNRRRANH